jgi:hypothetical protein
VAQSNIPITINRGIAYRKGRSLLQAIQPVPPPLYNANALLKFQKVSGNIQNPGKVLPNASIHCAPFNCRPLPPD